MSHVSLVQTNFKPECKVSPLFFFWGWGYTNMKYSQQNDGVDKQQQQKINKLTGDYVTITVFRFVVGCNVPSREHASRQFLQ